ncbi:hypothetical protein, partial [Ilumatobacter sp.]|uniref:hypothetical protein n=1 Tax=Ilumatobacter sp. TaxID=1967498 RepID=UPI003F6CDDFD
EAAKGETKIDFALRWGRRAPVADLLAATDGVEFVDNVDLSHVDLAALAEARTDDDGQGDSDAGIGSEGDPGDTLPVHDDT